MLPKLAKVKGFGLAHTPDGVEIRQSSGADPRPDHQNKMVVAREQKITR
jgi:hypothetical protein